DEAQRRLTGLAGITGVTAIGDGVPFTGASSSSWFLKQGEEDAQHRRTASQRRIVPSYFAVLGIPVLSGRAFSAEDRVDAPLVATVTESAARCDWPNESPFGKRVKYQGEWRTIVGVVGDSKPDKLSADVEATIYTPVAQRGGSLSFMARTRNTP